MEEALLYKYYFIGLAIAVVVILAAAILLLLVRKSAKRILTLASAALGIVTQIKENTNSIWGLEKTNEVAGNILEGAKAIETHAGIVAEALYEPQKSES